MPVRTRIDPFPLVLDDIEEVKLVQDLAVVPEHEHFKHEAPPWNPFGYALWHPLIIRSQHVQNENTFIARIPSFMWEDLMRYHSAWVATNRIPQTLLDEFIELWTSTQPGKDVARYLDGERKWFIRLDQMSPKDSPLGGKLPSTTLQEVVTKVCSSMHGYGCLQRECEDAKTENREMEIKLVLNKWDEKMDACREYRVFVPPPLARLPRRSLHSVQTEDMKMNAISQYRWSSPYVPPYPNKTPEEIAQNIQEAAEGILQQIIDYMNTDLSDEIETMLIQYGFTFDIIIREGGDAQLVEINPFGALSGCGACLFNGVVDGKILYGLDRHIEFAITILENEEEGRDRV